MARQADQQEAKRARLRIDPAHPQPADVNHHSARSPEGGSEESMELFVAAWSDDSPDSDHPALRQAQQIAEHLRREHDALQEREAALNAQRRPA